MTVHHTRAAGEEDIKGTITPDKLADLVVLDRDPFGLRPSALAGLRVLMTVVDGRVVFEELE